VRTSEAATYAGPWGAPDEFVTVEEVKQAARARTEPMVWNFIVGGAGDEWTLAQNRLAFRRWQFRPRVLRGIGPPKLATTFLGLELATPLVVAPFGFDRAMHPDGHLAVVRGAGAAGADFIVPVVSSFPLEAVRAAAPRAARIFQVVAAGSDATFLSLGERAAAAGYHALCVTVDVFVPGWRERSIEDRYVPDPAILMGNLAPHELAEVGAADAAEWTWERLAGLCAQLPIPWMAKGILSADDARAAVDAGASAVVVSNHGGRQLDGAPAALDKLEEVVRAVGDRAEVALDGGVRRGSDVLKALALGARIVGVGRPVAYGLAAAGERGVRTVLELLDRELITTMALCGRSTIYEVDRSLVEEAPVGAVGTKEVGDDDD
jgi:isopentenyl diphosphate isomerase/L-lactate dehydrogenase-like FMN-dependent dehydrogenase